MISRKCYLLSINKQTLYIIIIKTRLIELFPNMINNNFSLVFDVVYTSDLINNIIMLTVSYKYGMPL